MWLSRNTWVLDSFSPQKWEVNACSMWSGYPVFGFTDIQLCQHDKHSFNWSNNKVRFSFNQTIWKRWGARLVTEVKHLPLNVFLWWHHHYKGGLNFEINLIFLIKSFFWMSKKSRQEFKYLEIEKSFSD